MALVGEPAVVSNHEDEAGRVGATGGSFGTQRDTRRKLTGPQLREAPAAMDHGANQAAPATDCCQNSRPDVFSLALTCSVWPFRWAWTIS